MLTNLKGCDVMKEFSIPLKKKYERPIIELYKLPALIDTGAVIPVVSLFPSIIEKYFDCEKILNDGFIGGFGGLERGSVYSIKNFEIGEIKFKDFEIFVPNNPKLQFPFLLSATLFYSMDYEFDTINEKFIVRVNDEKNLNRDFKIKSLNGKLYPQIDGILFQDIDMELQSFYIF